MSILVESAVYTPNAYINNLVAEQITGYSFRYDAKVIDNSVEIDTPILM